MKQTMSTCNYTRRDFLKGIGLGAVSLALPGCASASEQLSGRRSIDKPNIVIIISDDQGWKDVGYHGADFETPYIDSIASDGVELDRFYACPVCSPTRAGLMTGRYPIRFGLQWTTIKAWGSQGLPVEEELLPEMLAKAGYKRRGVFGKWHLGCCSRKYHPLSQGFTHFYGHYCGSIDYLSHKRLGALDWHRQFELSYDEGYSTQLLGKEAAKFIEESPKGEPFFLYVPFNAIHTPNQVLESYMERYEHITNKKRREKAAMVACMDDEIGRILQTLDNKGIAQDTLVLFFSDNGGAVQAGSSNLPLRDGKHSVYEGGIRVPAAIRWPRGLKGGRKVTVPMSYIDVFPTLQRIVGVRKHAGKPLDGEDVFDILRGGVTHREWEFHSYFQSKGIKQDKLGSEIKFECSALNTNEWKLVRVGPDMLKAADAYDKAEISLFRISKDPYEQENVAGEYPGVVKNMLKKIKTFREWQPAIKPVSLTTPEGWKPPETWEIPAE